MAWPFNRNKTTDTTDVPKEVRDYYQSERREHMGVAWLLALGTLLLTMALAVGLFFGGRWVYRTLFDNSKDQPAVIQNESGNEQERGQTPTSEPNGTAGDNQGTPTPTGGPSTPSTQGSTTPSTTPATGELPDTGPGDHFD